MLFEHEDDSPSTAKRQQIQRPCDVCRRRKTRCDGPSMPDRRCSYCLAGNLTCTYDEPTRRRLLKDPYVQELETRLKEMEALLQQPDTMLHKDNSSHVAASRTTAPSAISSSTATSSRPEEDSASVHKESLGLAQWLEQLNIDPSMPRFHGETSWIAGLEPGVAKHSQAQAPHAAITSEHINRRPEFWQTHQWEKQGLDRVGAHEHRQRFDFPPQDLLLDLVNNYFEEVNLFLPVLYRPAFDALVKRDRHLEREDFAYVVLMVCALGCPFVEDRRILLDDNTLSSGWKYFNQVQLVRRSLLAPPTLYELQLCCLASVFLASSSSPQAYWHIIGMGMRMSLDIGLHRKQVYSREPSVQEEQWKRAFWVLTFLDQHGSIGLGRPSAVQSEDIDADMPLEVDDEFWEHPSDPFVQPPGRPARVSMFVRTLKLHTIMSYAMKTIYSIKKSQMLLDFVGPESEWEQKIVAQLDSHMNEWADSLPKHLRWDPKCEDLTFLYQSAALWSLYYETQIRIHRSFLTRGIGASRDSLPSLTICLSAARACSRIIEVHQRRRGNFVPIHISGAVTSATILLFNIKSGSRSGLTLDTSNEMADVYRCMNLLKDCEKRWPMAGRLWDILSGLASTVDALPFTSQTIPMNKRKRALYELDPGPVASKDHASTLVSRVSASSSIGLSGHEAPSWSVNDLLIDESEQFRDVFAAPSNIPSTLVTGMAGDTLFTWPAVTNTSESDDWEAFFKNFARDPFYG